MVQISASLLLHQMLQTLELVDVERLETYELVPGDEGHLLSRVDTRVSAVQSNDLYQGRAQYLGLSYSPGLI